MAYIDALKKIIAGTALLVERELIHGSQFIPTQSLADTPPLNYTVLATDIVGYGRRDRTDTDRRLVHRVLYQLLSDAFQQSGVPWSACIREDRGDGVLVLVPPTVSTVLLVDPVLPCLAAALGRHNRRHGSNMQVQLRAALDVGPVALDPLGQHGQVLINAARMLDAPALRREARAGGADLALVTSVHVYQTVVSQVTGAMDPATFRRIRFHVKETRAAAWMHLAGSRETATPRAATQAWSRSRQLRPV